jgi:hypothetical protein
MGAQKMFCALLLAVQKSFFFLFAVADSLSEEEEKILSVLQSIKMELFN